jgi:uncharacterized protein (TIRG00374 family)
MVMKKERLTKFLAAVFTVATLVVVYSHIDLHLLLRYLSDVHPVYLGLAVFAFLPQILVASLRWRIMIAGVRRVTLMESVRLNMAGKALNALVPSNMGEMSKAYFLKRDDAGVDMACAVSAVLLEKMLDLWGLCAVLLLGVILTPEPTPAVWTGWLIAGAVLAGIGVILILPVEVLGRPFANRGYRLSKIADFFAGWDMLLRGLKARDHGLVKTLGLSVLVWMLHVLQLYLFFPTLRHPVPVAPALAYLPLAVLAGFLPVTVGGMGTRDSALILLFASYADSALMAGIGLLCTVRYWVDTLMGVPFFHQLAARRSVQETDQRSSCSGVSE